MGLHHRHASYGYVPDVPFLDATGLIAMQKSLKIAEINDDDYANNENNVKK